MEISGEVRIALRVPAYTKTRDFYEKILGLTVVDEWSRGEGDNGVIYMLGSTMLEILEGVEFHTGPGFYVYIEVPDVDAVWKKLSTIVEVVDAIGTRPWKHRNFSIKDPNGFVLKFFSKL